MAPLSEKIAGGFQQAGEKEGSLGKGIFARLLDWDWGQKRGAKLIKDFSFKIGSSFVQQLRPIKTLRILRNFWTKKGLKRILCNDGH